MMAPVALPASAPPLQYDMKRAIAQERCWSCIRYSPWTDDWVRVHPGHPGLRIFPAPGLFETPHPRGCACAYHEAHKKAFSHDMLILANICLGVAVVFIGHWVFGWW